MMAAAAVGFASCSDNLDPNAIRTPTRTAEELANMRVVELLAEDMPCNSDKYLHPYKEYYFFKGSGLRMDYGGQEFLLRMPDLSEVGLKLTAVTSDTYSPERTIEIKPEDTKFTMTFDNIKVERLNELEFIFSTTFNRTPYPRWLLLKFEGPASNYQKTELGMDKTAFYIEVSQDENLWEIEDDIVGGGPATDLTLTADGVDLIRILGFIGVNQGWILPSGESDILISRSSEPELNLECARVTKFLVTETDFNHADSELTILADRVKDYIKERNADVKWVQAPETVSASSDRVSIYDQTANTFRMHLPANTTGHDRVFAMVCSYQPTLTDKRWFHHFTPFEYATYFIQMAE